MPDDPGPADPAGAGQPGPRQRSWQRRAENGSQQGPATYVSAPVRRTFVFDGQRAVSLSQGASRRLWQAVRHDAVAAFARRYPSSVTPIAPH